MQNKIHACSFSYNTGVILMDLRKLRSIGWNGLWRSVAVKTLVTHYWTSLADQDIFNTIIKERPKLLYPMPCQWNVQLSDNTRSELCYAEVVELKVCIFWQILYCPSLPTENIKRKILICFSKNNFCNSINYMKRSV